MPTDSRKSGSEMVFAASSGELRQAVSAKTISDPDFLRR
jgi:hypothetical protein